MSEEMSKEGEEREKISENNRVMRTSAREITYQSGKTFQVNEKVFLIIRKTRVFRNIFSFQTY